MTVAAIALVLSIFVPLGVFFCLMSIRDNLEGRISDLHTANILLDQQLAFLRNDVKVQSITERVPVREKCPCGHHAFTHDSSGCQQSIWFGHADCACRASREQVMFTPNPLKQLS